MNILLNEAQMSIFGRLLGEVCQNGSVIYLDGTLGMGKTTLSRALIQGLGWQSRVKSPTYTLVEEYKLSAMDVFHFDLYRLSDPEELEYIGIRDLDSELSIWLIEWPEKGEGFLPAADLKVEIQEAERSDARSITVFSGTEKGTAQLKSLQLQLESELL